MNQSRSRAQLHTATRALISMLAQTVPQRDLLQASIEALSDLIQVRYGALGVLDEEGNLCRSFHAGIGSEADGLRGVSVRHDSTWSDTANDTCRIIFPSGRLSTNSMLAVPLSLRGRVYARVYLCDKVDLSPFTEEDEELVSDFASALSHILDQVRRRERRMRVRSVVTRRLFRRESVPCHHCAS